MAQKQARLALKAALTAALNKNTFLNDDAFIARWIDQADDRVFEQLGDEIAACGEIGRDLEIIYSVIIALARQARRTAEEVKTGRDPMVDASEEDRSKALDLARKADDLAIFCRSSGVSGKLDLASLLLPVFGKPSLASLIGPMAELDVLFRQNGMMSLQQLAELHEREASLLGATWNEWRNHPLLLFDATSLADPKRKCRTVKRMSDVGGKADIQNKSRHFRL